MALRRFILQAFSNVIIRTVTCFVTSHTFYKGSLFEQTIYDMMIMI